MSSLILTTATRLLLPLMLVFSLFVFLRGHNEPGGGFIAALVTAAAVELHGLAGGVASARRLLRVRPLRLIGLGLLLAALSGLFGPLLGQPYLTGQWLKLEFAGESVKLGTPLLFDVGVYLVVFGISLMILFAVLEVDEEATD